MRILGYVRTSTGDQENGIAAQRSQLQAEAKARGWELTIIEERASGKTLARRPVLQHALSQLKAGEFNGLAVTKLDRLARSVLDFASIVQRATSESWALICLDLSLDTSSPNGRFTAHILAAVAQLERDLISQRTREALAVVKSKGVTLGHPSTIAAGTVKRIARLRNHDKKSWQEIADILNRSETLAPRGGKWTRETIRHAYARAGSDSHN